MDLEHVDVIDLSAGTYGAGEWITPSGEVEEGYLGALARRYRERTGALVAVAGRITTPASAETLVASGAADLICVARAMHADPDWSRHAIEDTDPRPCISCNQGCADVVFSGRPIWCAVNPSTGEEGRPRHSPTPRRSTQNRSWAAVVGGGPAGLEAAVTSRRLGSACGYSRPSRTSAASTGWQPRLRAKPQFGRLLTWYANRLQQLGVDVRAGVTATPAQIAGSLAVVLATGGNDYIPPVPGLEEPRVRGVRSWLGGSSVSGSTDRSRSGAPIEPASTSRTTSCAVVGSSRSWRAKPSWHPTQERERSCQRSGGSTGSPRVTLHLGCTVEQIAADTVAVSRAGAVGGRRAWAAARVARSDPRCGRTPLGTLDPPAFVDAVDTGGEDTFDAAFRAGRASAVRLLHSLRDATPGSGVRTPA